MGITSVDEDYSGRGGGINAKWERTYVRVFDVVTSDPYVGVVAIRLDSRIPAIGSVYTNGLSIGNPLREYDNGSFAQSHNYECLSEGAGIGWRVTVNYGPYNTAEFGSSPTSYKIRVRFGGERTERVVDFDRYGNPLMNTAGDRFGDPVTVDDHIRTMIITRNEPVSTFDPELASELSDTLNDATWNGFPAGYCKMGIIETSEEQWDSFSQLWYYTVTYPVAISRGKPWRKDLLDQGFNELDAYGDSKPIMYKGQPVSDARPLDGSGHVLDGTDGYSSPVVLPFDVYDVASWSALAINISLRLGV